MVDMNTNSCHHHADVDQEIRDHDRGLAFDLPTLMNRRRALSLLAVGGLASLVACGSSSDSSSESASTEVDGTAGSTTAAAAADGTTEIPDETAGPYPGDGSNGVNVLTESGIVRQDIVSSFGDASGTAEGLLTTVEMTLLDVAGGGGPLAGAAVYIWHCTVDGKYSLYDQEVANENFLRGVQESDSNGQVTFKTVYPGCYAGRWPHIHFEVFESLEVATAAGSKLKTSQIALPEATNALVYATTGYEQSVQNLGQNSLDQDNVFSDGYASQLATASGTLANGLTLKLNVGV